MPVAGGYLSQTAWYLMAMDLIDAELELKNGK